MRRMTKAWLGFPPGLSADELPRVSTPARDYRSLLYRFVAVDPAPDPAC